MFNSIVQRVTMSEKDKPNEEKKRKEEETEEPQNLVSEEMLRWMTEGTSPCSPPRSDCG
jgi:hypothetical protein